MDLLDQYIKELGEDTALDEFNVRDVQMKLPAIQHKWAGRLMRAKSDNSKLERKKKKVIKDLTQKLVKDSPVKLSLPIAEKIVQDLDDIQDIADFIGHVTSL